jgi:hypothetical protein
MNDETKEVWEIRCEQAVTERDPAKLIELITEINKMLDEKYERLMQSLKQP